MKIENYSDFFSNEFLPTLGKINFLTNILSKKSLKMPTIASKLGIQSVSIADNFSGIRSGSVRK